MLNVNSHQYHILNNLTFRSRWTMFFWCMCSSPCKTCLMYLMTCSSVRASSDTTFSNNSPPETSSFVRCKCLFADSLLHGEGFLILKTIHICLYFSTHFIFKLFQLQFQFKWSKPLQRN